MLSDEAKLAIAKMRADGYQGTPTMGQLKRYGWSPAAPLAKVKPSTAALSPDEKRELFVALAEEAEANKTLPFDKIVEVLGLVGSLIP